MDYIGKNNNEYDIMLTFENVKIFIFANLDGITNGTSGNIIYPDKKVYQILMTEELKECIEKLIEQ